MKLSGVSTRHGISTTPAEVTTDFVQTVSVFLVFVALIFALPNKWFAWFEYYTSILKVSALIIFMIAAFAMTMGAGSTGTVHTGETWRDYPVFKNGFKGLANSMLAALWAIGDNVLTGIMAGEAKSPRHSMAHATKLVPVRVSVVYLLTVVFITILIPSTEPRLFGGSGVAASPFVIAANDAGIKGLPDYLNVIIIVSNPGVFLLSYSSMCQQQNVVSTWL